MKTELVRIGNSRGIRIPKPIIDQCGFGESVELRLEGDCLIISPQRKPRDAWDELFRKAGSAADDELLLEGAGPAEFDRMEWEW